jgi:hypothetical protein
MSPQTLYALVPRILAFWAWRKGFAARKARRGLLPSEML